MFRSTPAALISAGHPALFTTQQTKQAGILLVEQVELWFLWGVNWDCGGRTAAMCTVQSSTAVKAVGLEYSVMLSPTFSEMHGLKSFY